MGNVLSRILENPENPVGWSVFVARVGGVSVRLHLLTVVFVAAMLLSILRDGHGVQYMALAMGALLVVVFVHELGHVAACRWSGGEAGRVVLLPWGGLDLAQPRDDWRSHLVTALGGPLANVVLMVVLAGVLVAAGQGHAVVFDPLNLTYTLSGLGAPERAWLHFALVGLWFAHVVNAAVLVCNALLVMYPFDGARVLRALLWRKRGYKAAARGAVAASFACGLGLAVLALVFDHTLMLALACVGIGATALERRRLQGAVEIAADVEVPAGPAAIDDDDLFAPIGDEFDNEALMGSAEQRAADAVPDELDALLEKVSREGVDGLSEDERERLERLRQERFGG